MSRRGYSLTEVLVVMGMTSVVLTIGLGMVRRVMHEQRATERDNAMHRVAERLSTKLREDVGLATDAELIPARDGNRVRLVLHQPDERTVTYAVGDNVIERTSTRESEPTHRDSFRFPDNYVFEFDDVSAGHVRLTAFAFPYAYLAMADGGGRGEGIERDAHRVVMCVEAAVGRDHRFLLSELETSEP